MAYQNDATMQVTVLTYQSLKESTMLLVSFYTAIFISTKLLNPKEAWPMGQFLNLLLLLGTLQFDTASISLNQMTFILLFPVNLKIVSDIIYTFQACLLNSKRNLDHKAVMLVSN